MFSPYKLITLFTIFNGLAVVMGEMRLRATSIKCTTGDHHLVANLTCSMSDDPEPKLSGQGILTSPIDSLHLHYRAASYVDGKAEIFYSGDLNLCDVLGSQHLDYMIAMLLDDLKHHSNLPHTCQPQPNTAYSINNFTLNHSLIPLTMPERKGYVKMELMTGKNILIEVLIEGIAEHI